MEKAGDIFQKTREEKGFSIGQIIKATKIPHDFIVAIENNDYSLLPKGLYPSLYVRKYAGFLGLSPERMMALFRRDNEETKIGNNPFLKICFSPYRHWRKLFGGLAIIFIFSGYLLYQYLSFVRPPRVKLEVNFSPSGEIIIKGDTNPEAILKIDNESIALDEKGGFTYIVKDKEEIKIRVESPSGKIKEFTKPLTKGKE